MMALECRHISRIGLTKKLTRKSPTGCTFQSHRKEKTMPKVLTDGKTKIGAYHFSDRKKPCLCIEEGNSIVVYGHFNTFEGADEFMNRLGKLVSARMDGGEDE